MVDYRFRLLMFVLVFHCLGRWGCGGYGKNCRCVSFFFFLGCYLDCVVKCKSTFFSVGLLCIPSEGGGSRGCRVEYKFGDFTLIWVVSRFIFACVDASVGQSDQD